MCTHYLKGLVILKELKEVSKVLNITFVQDQLQYISFLFKQSNKTLNVQQELKALKI